MNSSPPGPSIGVLAVNYNGGQAILNCLHALTRQSTPLEEILVVDNGSTDGSPVEISRRYPDARLVELPQNLGLSKAHNIGLRQATAEALLVIDDDVYVDADCIGHLERARKEWEAAVVCPRILLYPENRVIQCDGAAPHFVGTLRLRHPFQPLDETPSETAEVSACIGACMLVDRACVLASGGFDEEYFFYFEDLEFSLRMRGLGHRIVCEPRALVYHDRGTGRPELSFRGHEAYPVRRAYFHIRHRLMTLLIHYRPRTLVVLAPVLLLYEIVTLAVCLRRGWARHWWAALRSVWAARGHLADRRRFVMQNRRRGDGQLLTGGDIPLAPGFLHGAFERRAVGILSASLNLYWKLCRPLLG